MDIYNAHKTIKARHVRNPDDEDCRAHYEISRELIVALVNGLRYKRILQRYIKIEEKSFRFCSGYGRRIREAINNDSYTLDIPYQVLPRYKLESDEAGYVYLASSGANEYAVKIGVTMKMHPVNRIRKFNNRHYCDFYVLWYALVDSPRKFESHILKKYRLNRSSINAEGYSNEIFFVDNVDRFVDEVEVEFFTWSPK